MGSGVKYTPEFRAEAVRLVTERSRPVADVAGELSVSKHTLYGWLKKAKLEAMTAEEIEESETASEVKRLKRELADARMENEFLKKAAAFFAAETGKSGTG